VLDLKLPNMDGLQVLKVLSRVRGEDRRRFAPVVVLSQSDADHDVSEAYRYGAFSYIAKPQAPAEFCEAVRQIVGYWLGLNRPMPRPRCGTPFMHEGL
jgi:two-component system response regulator